MKIVAIAGHFNPIHSGHINLIKEAKKLGDKLIVILANDIQAGNKRRNIFMSFDERRKVLESIKEVDMVVQSVDIDTNVCETLQYIRPHVFASGCPENHPDAIEERKVADKLGIQCVYGIGGEKIQSSSNLLYKFIDLKEEVKFVTPAELEYQLGIHETKIGRKSKLHWHKEMSEFFYVEMGKIDVVLTDKDFNIIEKKTLSQGDTLYIPPEIGHEITFHENSRVLEVHKGPYKNDKIFN